jgi:hypothetical protein
MNVTEDDLRTYIDLFHSTLESTAKEFLPEDDRKNLLHLSLTPARIIGYVSTQFGVAIEYEPATSTQIEIRRGSARVEDLFVQAPSALRRVGPIIAIGASGTGIYRITLSDGFPFRLTEREASVTFGDVVFEAGRWKRLVHFAEVFGDRARELWAPEKAVSRAKNEVLVALVEISRALEKNISVPEYIDKFKKKTVLVLGDYETGLKRLESICRILGELGYEPIMLRDIPDHPHHDIRQKVVAIGAISRFVVVDDSSKSGHLLEVELCDQNKWVTILLRVTDHGGSWMTAGLSHQSNVILEQPYDPSSLEGVIPRISEWAEKKLEELKVKYDSTYPWRMKGS